MQFEIPGRLPGTNEIIAAAKNKARNYKAYSVMKDENTDMVAWLTKKLPSTTKLTSQSHGMSRMRSVTPTISWAVRNSSLTVW